MVEKEVKQYPTRYDKNLAHNPEDFSIYESASELAMYLSIYLAREYQYKKDWYSPVIRLDMNHFCEVMGYDKATLLQKTLAPAHLSHWRPESDEYLMERVIEDALYRMVTQTIIFTRQGARKKEGRYQSITGMQLLKKVQVFIDEQNRNKIYYDIELGEVFRENLNVFYIVFSLNSDVYKKLRKNNLTSLFLFLQNQQNKLQLEIRKNQYFETGAAPIYSSEYSFDELCRLAEIRSSDSSDRKKALNKKIHTLNTIAKTGWQLNWNREAGQSYSFVPAITFLGLSNQTDEDKFKNEKQTIFNEEVNKELFIVYQKNYLTVLTPEEALPFDSWKKNNKLNYELKIEAIQRVQMLIWSSQTTVNPALF